MTRLYMINGQEKGREYEVTGEEICIGRSQENQITFNDKSVSRRHLKIIHRENRFFIVDLKSTNGTFLDSKPIEPNREYPVEEGVPIGAGNVIFSLGKPGPREIMSVQDSIDLSGDFGDTGIFNRPGTSPKNLELIYKVSSVLMGSLKINEILEKILDAIFELLKRIDRGAIILLDADTGEISEVISRSTKEKNRKKKIYSRTIVEKVIRERKAISYVDTMEEEDLEPSRSMVFMKIRSVMCVPLISRSEIRGVIYVDSVSKPFGFRKEDLSLLTTLCGPAAIAIENALLYSNAEKLVAERNKSLKETERRLRESEARFKAIFDNMSSGVGVFEAVDSGENFKILDLNRANQKAENIDKKNVVGKFVSDVFPVSMKNDLFKVLKRVWKTGKPEHCSISSQWNKEGTGWREYDVYRLPSKEIVAIFDDITDRLKAEEEQKALHQQLLVSQKMESIGAFAGGTAHNFRNILQAISGNVEYMEVLYADQPEVQELAKSIYDSVEKGVDLINSLLHFSRRGGGYQLKNLDLCDVIKKACEIIDRVFNKNIEIKANLEEGLFMTGNQSLLSQVFMNLFTNARDAMPNGGILRIQAKRNKDKIIVTVSDTGYGMDKDTMEKIFDPFFTLKDVGKGTGLGLSTTHGIIEEHEGSISVTSKVGKGATFKIIFPYSESERRVEEEVQKNIKFGKGQKILIVDDERSTLDALEHLTNSLGYQAIAYDKPREAVKNYKRLSPDLVLMDRSMPDLDGIACISEIMKEDQNAKIIIVSGYEESGPDGIEETVKGKIKGYLTKPCGIEELSLTLSDALEL